MSAADHLLGSGLDWLRAQTDRSTALKRAEAEGELKVVEALAAKLAELVGQDAESARRAALAYLPKIMRQLENKQAVLALTFEDLAAQATPNQEADSAPDRLSDQFLHRFDALAGDATSDEIREKWAKVLASEIRNPGTFSPKVLRILDELEPETAKVFERVSKMRLGRTISKAISGKLTFDEAANLTAAGLLVEPGMGQTVSFEKRTADEGGDVWLAIWGDAGVLLPIDATVKVVRALSSDMPLTLTDNVPALRVYVLTAVGAAVASIIPHDPVSIAKEIAGKIRDKHEIPGVEFVVNEGGAYRSYPP